MYFRLGPQEYLQSHLVHLNQNTLDKSERMGPLADQHTHLYVLALLVLERHQLSLLCKVSEKTYLPH